MTARERILKYIESKGISKYQFYKDTGISNGFLDKDGNMGSDKCEIICSVYKDVSIEWLIMGRGPMLIDESSGLGSAKVRPYAENLDYMYSPKVADIVSEPLDIPVYDIRASAGLKLLYDGTRQNILDKIRIPHVGKVDGAMFITGDSMYPLLKSGDIVIFKKINDFNYLQYGDIYLISYSVGGDDYLVIKYVQKSEKEKHIRLASYNTNHQPLDIPISSINVVALVKASIRYNAML